MAVQAKFFVSEIAKLGYNKAVLGQTRVKLQATSRKDESSQKFWAATPTGTFEMTLSSVDGEAAGRWFEERLGQDISLTFEDWSE